MGKRSDFKRRPQDAYDTPCEAVAPLLRFLPSRSLFWEPCAGKGDLLDALLEAGHEGYGTDIEPRATHVGKMDALLVTRLFSAQYIITNPPWTRSILHPMIEHFSAMRPTWLLFDADWVHTKQAAPYLPHLRKIVSVGRVKWIPDSPYTGKVNCAWHLFDQNAEGVTEFVGRAA
ncbi:class I SAM-dependent methyltransferase [Roseobacter sp. HKCCD9010]|uniref:class I SAM-dependent methyltransferase n=1 Tax=unclassified Roseobacter TaxID=196798 RepID=UPI0014930BF4|nr:MULTISPECIES: class I SAM-dependent methyltransferase [unclassified Roseobacter]MBF9050656.1 class I SAM-dependent methyltransferase [Rhodobacterales bacterium HKCCD4356]NNV11926.1 class I SAM-dependent methyltransferase [Roseobacter sp. HKCCD7357]NNV16939.1 class I SAM-dependent methyltransferase [Roseobacter sp. HKCCD8768]NNV26168.1 class I SAM-dependent methyltransferase [Roseobacter sp. HKCCD8192]NNV30661.1 class I SAM-dependent methyltransferase [Roseobacter sp. HKCCD9061]